MLSKQEIKHLGLFYLNSFIGSISMLFAPFLIIYLQKQGLSFFQISTVLAAFMISPLLFEIPTGIIADRYGRKFSVILGQFLMAIVSFFIPSFKGYLPLILAFILWGAVLTFISGADYAWVIDNLKNKKKDNLIDNYLMKRVSITSLGTLAAAFISAMVVKFTQLDYIWYFQALGFFLAGVILIFQKEYGFNIKKQRTNSIIKKSIGLFKKKYIIYFLIGILLTQLTFSLFQLIWQPLLVSFGLAIHKLGYVYAIIALAGIFSPLFAKKLSDKFRGERKALSFISIFQGLIILIIIFLKDLIYLIVPVIALTILGAIRSPISARFLHKKISSDIRATFGSLYQMILGISGAFTFLLGGLLMDNLNIQYVFIIASALSILGALAFMKIRN